MKSVHSSVEQAMVFPRLASVVTAAPTDAPRPHPDPVLTATIEAAADGDQDAFGRLYAAYVRLVHAILLGRVPRADVDDLVQDVFLTAYSRLRELRDPGAFGG
ncbi:MAG TPA: sigma factor, partial [Vicinamibacterales bacterium]|nr:sigma factor [Vicinamibacterales bacterium]